MELEKLKIAQQTEQPLPDGTTIVQIYERAEQELLILGEHQHII